MITNDSAVEFLLIFMQISSILFSLQFSNTRKVVNEWIDRIVCVIEMVKKLKSCYLFTSKGVSITISLSEPIHLVYDNTS